MRAGSKRSFEKFSYLLRPSKQVERKLFVEALHRLRAVGYDFSTYKYLGLGSVFYADFVLFHKYLYVDDMLCCEVADIPKRMKFNLPYEFVDLKMNSIAEVLPSVSQDRKHLAWLDYDVPFSASVEEDVRDVVSKLCPGSIIVVTVDAEPRHPDRAQDRKLSARQRRKKVLEYYSKYNDILGHDLTADEVTDEGLPETLARILRATIDGRAARRGDVRYWQLFSFRYADGAQMVTIGGLLDDESAKARLDQSGIYELDFVTAGDTPVEISVPPLTTREKLWLDQNSHGNSRLPFEIDPVFVQAFRKYRRHYPTYSESVF